MSDLSNWVKAAQALDHATRPTPLERALELAVVYRKRNQLFGAHAGMDIFSDPAWHMLLDLYIATRTGKEISVSSLCIASHAPQTTALRHINIMVRKGLMVRTPDAQDSRRIFVTLSPAALEMMDSVLA